MTRPQSRAVLRRHTVGGTMLSSSMSNGQTVPSLLGSTLTTNIDGGTMSVTVPVTVPRVTATDTVARNDVIHVIDTVLLP